MKIIIDGARKKVKPMADAKSGYSETATKFTHSESGKFEGLKSKAREAKYNENWKTQSVNINEVVEKFAPNAEGGVKNGKFIYFGDSSRYGC